MWCYDSKGKRIVPTAEEQAAEISQKLAEYPHLVEGMFVYPPLSN